MQKCRCGHWDRVHQLVCSSPGAFTPGCTGWYTWREGRCDCTGFVLATDLERVVMDAVDG